MGADGNNAPLPDLLGSDCDPADVVDHVGLSRSGRRVAVVTLSRPEKRNPLSLGSWKRLAGVFDALAREPELRAVVIRGAGTQAFGAGADIAEFPQARLGAAAAVGYNESISAALTAVGRVPVPVIAMVRGLAVGGGCELSAAADVRICSDDSRFGIPIGRLGVILGLAEARALVGLIGKANLKRLLFTGELISAEEAVRIGLAQLSVPGERLVGHTVDMVEAILASSAVTMRAAKQVADMCDRELTAEDAEALTRLTIEAYDGPDLREGVEAFLARRPPVFADAPAGTSPDASPGTSTDATTKETIDGRA